jgi:hypothetical protein
MVKDRLGQILTVLAIIWLAMAAGATVWFILFGDYHVK